MAAAPSIGTQAKFWPKQEDWEKHRFLIERLYRELPLAKVMKTMGCEHGFIATCVQSFISASRTSLIIFGQSENVQKPHHTVGSG